jgi:hypothetical protein
MNEARERLTQTIPVILKMCNLQVQTATLHSFGRKQSANSPKLDNFLPSQTFSIGVRSGPLDKYTFPS